MKSQHKSILTAAALFAGAVVIVGLIGYFTIGRSEEVLQGQLEVAEYRVSSKVPGRILEIRVKEGDFVHVGDTLAILDAPDIEAKRTQAQSVAEAAGALNDKAQAGARQEQVNAAYQVWQQAEAGAEIARRSYERVQNLYDEGVMTAQKRDEAFANYKAMEAQAKAAKSQYEMARNGARREEKAAAAAQLRQAEGAVREVESYIHETVQTSLVEGEVSEVYLKVGELCGTGSPIMGISVLNDRWGAFNVREDKLGHLQVGSTFTAFVPAFNQDIEMKVYFVKDLGSFAAYKATKTTGDYDLKTFEVRARPVTDLEGLRPGMTLIMKNE